jgi:hypothetical protein
MGIGFLRDLLNTPVFGTRHAPADLELQLGTGASIDNPSSTQIAFELARLPIDGDGYAVLTRRNGEFVQTARDGDGFCVEYSDAGGHFTSKDDPQSLATATEVLQPFAAGDASWKALLRWEFDGRDFSHD